MSEMICKTVAVAFSHYYTNNSLNKILYKFNKTYIYRKLYKMSRFEEIFVPVYILGRIIENAILYFFKTIALSSRVIKVCCTTIRSILHKHNACLSYEENSNVMVKICNLGRISEPGAFSSRVQLHLC